ncbi:hypothetical protein [Pantoea septica]|uniref:hypothetical protein n=1 Tax=Pantoea septica TaxID=472695 RepID=UPI003D075256
MARNATDNTASERHALEEEIWGLFKKIEKNCDKKQQTALREEIWRLAALCPDKNKPDKHPEVKPGQVSTG